MSGKIAFFIGLNLFLVISEETIIAGWASTYVVLAKLATKKQGSFFATAFWLSYSITLFFIGFIQIK